MLNNLVTMTLKYGFNRWLILILGFCLFLYPVRLVFETNPSRLKFAFLYKFDPAPRRKSSLKK